MIAHIKHQKNSISISHQHNNPENLFSTIQFLFPAPLFIFPHFHSKQTACDNLIKTLKEIQNQY